MVECPVCDGEFEIDETEIEEGDTITCEECGADLKIVGLDPLEVESLEDEEDEEDDDFLDDDEDEEEEDEDWR